MGHDMKVRVTPAPRPEPARHLAVPGAWGYVERIGVPPGGTVRFHVNAPAAYDLTVVRLGRAALLDAPTDDAADRADAQPLATFRHSAATPQTLSAGSYIFVDGPPIPAGPVTMGSWLRLWRLPVIDVIQWAWHGIMGDLDYPEASRFALLVDHAGRVCVYAGDGGAFRHGWLHVSDPVMAGRLGQWAHLAASIEPGRVVAYLDGAPILTVEGEIPSSGPVQVSRLRVGATAERGAANDFLDGDLAAPFLAASALGPDVLARVVADRAHSPLLHLGLGVLHAAWDLAEERGSTVADSSGNARHGTIVQGATWQIGGPAFDASRGVPGYEPATDPDRGHGLRLSSDDVADCEWSLTDEWTVPADAPSGIYAGLVRLAGQEASAALAITFAVVRRTPRRVGSVALLLATNTWYAYGRRPTDEQRIAGLSASFYSNHISGRPFFHVSTLAPIPRADPFGFESQRAALTRHSHLVRPERYAEAWLEREGYPYEVITDHDLHEEPGLLGGFSALLIVGHSEYWSDKARQGVLDQLAAGGKVISLSGNTLFWRTTFDPTMTILESRKTVPGEDARWLSPKRWGERWHGDDGRAGSQFPLLGRPAYEVLGLDTTGMIDDGTATSFAALDVVAPEHPLFHRPEVVPFSARGTIGERNLNGPKASGYEFDATAEVLGYRDEPQPGITVLASALGQRNIEWNGRATDRGADIILWEREDGGRVFNAGSIGITGALVVDSGLRVLLRNVMAEFGVPRDGG
jgi:hypothetical protein